MKELWSELVDYHDFYLPGVTTNMSEASHLYANQPTSCLPLIYKMTYTLAPSRVCAKWTGSKIIKYGGEAFRLRTCLSILKEACPSFRLHLLTLLNQSYSSSLVLQHHSWDVTQDNAREWRRDPAVKRKRIEKKWGTSKTNSPAKASATTYWPESQKHPRKRV